MNRLIVRILLPLMLLGITSSSALAIQKKKTSIKHTVKAKTVAVTKKVSVAVHQPVSHLSRLRATRKRYYYNPWTEPTFADSTAGDKIDGEDLAVRRAAVQALGPYNGTVVAVDPQTGRLLTIVNQNLAFKSGFQPCSTIKLVAALAGLNEGLIDRNTAIHVGRRTSMDLTEALARSNNFYFATVGNRLGFEKVEQYARLFGLGEKACFEEPEEQSGALPAAPPTEGGVGMMTSFGSGITLTPLQLAGLVTAMANGGTLYYLQHPRTQDEAAHLVPKVKRQLDIAQWIPEVKPGMEGAVEYGTARRASYNPNEPIFGKTGTCSDERFPGTHLGWFGSFNEANSRKLVVVVLLTGGRPVNGPVASGVAGAVYRNLSEQNYFGGQTVASN
jgi:cell division protein FtsI/penicillin-binding protein 2